MNFKKFFALASENGIEVSEINQNKSSELSIELFKKEITSYSIKENQKIVARGIYNNKMGFVSTEKDDKDTSLFIISSIKQGASLNETDDEAIIFKGSEKYKKKNVYSKELESWPTDDILKLLFTLEEKMYAKDSRVSDVEVFFSKETAESIMANSYGLVLKNKTNYFYFGASATIKEGSEVKSAFNMFLSNKPSEINLDEFVDETVKKGIDKLHGVTIAPNSYKAVLSRDVVSSLLTALISNASSEDVQKQSSLFAGKLNTQIVSPKITVEERPLEKNIFYQYFDDEGVATQNKVIIDKGVLKTYFYNLVTAKKDGVESTGNAQRAGSKMGIGFNNIFLKPGKLSEEELIAKVKNGVYITDVTGLHAGLNPSSGDFSLQAEGFHIKDGVKGDPLTLITVSGNLFKLFNDVIAVGNNTKLLVSATCVPSIAVDNVKVSAE